MLGERYGEEHTVCLGAGVRTTSREKRTCANYFGGKSIAKVSTDSRKF